MRLLSAKIFAPSCVSRRKAAVFRLHTKCFKKRRRPRKPPPSPEKARSEVPAKSALFESISGIVAGKKPAVVGPPSEILCPGEPGFRNVGLDGCRSSVCRNAQESAGLRSEGARQPEDVSPIVHAITDVVRTSENGIRMAERLQGSGLPFTAEIVEKVLKRCFKVGNLALRFFDWVKLRTGFRHTTSTYNVALCIASDAKEIDSVERLVGEMEEDGCPRDIKTWTVLVSHYGRANRVGKALSAFGQMRRAGYLPDKAAYEAILRCLIDARKGELAMEFYKEMVLSRVEVEPKFYRKLMNCLSVSGHAAMIPSVGKDMVDIAKVPEGDVYVHMMRSFCISGRTEEARELLEEIEKKKVGVLSLAAREIYLRGLCRAGKMEDAMEVVASMRGSPAIDSGLYGCLIDGFLRRNDIQQALELLSEMRRLGFVPMISCYTQVIQHQFSSGDYTGACEIYDEILKSGMELDIVGTTAMVAGHVRHGHIYEAWEAFHGMKKKGTNPTRKAYSVFIKELCKASEPIEAFKLLEEMAACDMSASDNILNLVISCLNRKGEVEKAREVEQMRKGLKIRSAQIMELADRPCQQPEIPSVPLIQDVSYVQAAENEYQESDLEELCKILASSADWNAMRVALEGSTIRFTPGLVESALRRSQRHGYAALHFFSWVGNRNGYGHSSETYNMAIKIAGAGKDFRHMRNLCKEMIGRNCSPSPNTWTIMISQYGQAGLTKMALKAFKEMEKHGHSPNCSTYKNLLVYICGKKGRMLDEAIKVFYKMVHAEHMPDRETVESFLSLLCESGKIEDARMAVDTLCGRGFAKQLGFSLLVRSICRGGKVEEALELTQELGELGCKMEESIFGSIIHALLRKGRLKEALDKMQAMEKDGLSRNTHILTSLLVYYCKEKQIEKAIEVFKEVKSKGLEPTIVTFSALIRGYMNVGLVSEAWNVFRMMRTKGPLPDFETCSMFMACLCKAGRSEEGMQLIHEMLELGIVPSAFNFRTVVFGLNREGKRELAHSVLKIKWLLNQRRRFIT